MKEENTGILSKIGPDLLVPPHILPAVMELLAGDSPPDSLQQDHLLSHLAACHYCRTAIVFMLKVAQEYDRINNNAEEPVRDLLDQFVRISQEAEMQEAREYERMGVYAETIARLGQEKADLSFPDIAAHMQICPDCRSVVWDTVAEYRGGSIKHV